MRKLLIFTYYWPPGSGPGVQRFVKFCKYLGELGWKPTVVTVRNGSYPSMDKSLEAEVPDDLKVFRTKTWEPFAVYNRLTGKKSNEAGVGFIGMKKQPSLFQRLALYIRANYFIPDARKGWNRFAIAQGRSLIKKEHFDAVITTGPPHSSHLIGFRLKKEFNIPHFVDLRDPWTNVYYNRTFPRTNRTAHIDSELEEQVCKASDGLIVVSEGMKSEFQNYQPNVRIIYNGYDEGDFSASHPVRNAKFTVSYIGNFKANQNVDVLWRSFSEILKSNSDFRRDLEICITGNCDATVEEALADFNLTEHTRIDEFVNHTEAVSRMISSDVLLFVIPNVRDNQLILTGKLFEYMASNRQMLSIGPVQGNAAKILSESDRGQMLDYEDETGIRKRIEQLYEDWVGTADPIVLRTNSRVTRFSRKNQTEELVSFLNHTLNGNG